MQPEILDPKITRFMILSDSRSGTMMLTDTLDVAPYVHFFNLFSANLQAAERFWLQWEEFQQQKVGEVTHLGTTMHRVGDEWLKRFNRPVETFWRDISDRNEKIVCLHRENKLRQILSRKVGYALKTYKVDTPRKVQPKPVHISPAELDHFADDLDQLRERIDTQLYDKLTVSFEGLDNQWNRNLARIEDYLGMPRTGRTPVTVRQETRPLREALANYEELESHLKATSRQHWLEE